MRFKRLLALLLAAALALSLLVGCGSGKNQSLSQMLLNLLEGQYQNVSVEIDSDLEAKLRQAISQSETDEELQAALEQLLGGGISFQRLGSGQQGDTAWTLIIYPGTDPDAAARSVYLDLDKVFAALPDDGVYSSGFAMAEMENGYAILVKATVDKAGTEDKPDPVTLKSIAVTTDPKLEYWVGEPFDPANMVITATYSNGTTKTITGITTDTPQDVTWDTAEFTSAGEKTVTITYGSKTATVKVTVKESKVDKIAVSGHTSTYTEGQSFSPSGMTVTVTYTGNIPDKKINSNYDEQGVTWTPDGPLAAGHQQLTITYTEAEKGSAYTTIYVDVASNTVDGEGFTYNKDTKEATISKGTGLQELFDKIGTEAASADITLKELESGETYTVTKQLTDNFTGKLKGTSADNKAQITLSGTSGLFGTIAGGAEVSYLDITVTQGISVSKTDGNNANAGAVAGQNYGTITGCEVIVNGTISAERSDGNNANAGGIAGYNWGTIDGNCKVEVTGTIQATGKGAIAYAGGIAGYNQGKIDGSCTVEVTGTIQATGKDGGSANAGGITGYNWGTINGNCKVEVTGTIQATGTDGGSAETIP